MEGIQCFPNWWVNFLTTHVSRYLQVPGYMVYMDSMCIVVRTDTRIHGVYGLYIYTDTSVFCLWLWSCIFVKVFSFNIKEIFKISTSSLISPFSQEALIKWQWGCSFPFTVANAWKQRGSLPWAILCRDDKSLAAVRSVGNLHHGAENVYCRERTFALWSHLLLVTSRFLIFYHRKFLVDHKSNPLSPAAGGEQWCTTLPGWASASSVGQSTCALQNANSVLLKQC